MTEDIPVFEDGDAKTEYINQCFDDEVPALLVDMVGKRTWAAVEFDMVTTGGDDHHILTESAIDEINEIAERYGEEEEISHRNNISALSAAYGSDFTGFPDMRPDVAQRFANEIAEIVLDESNWEPHTEALP